jgi:hypothetical protein
MLSSINRKPKKKSPRKPKRRRLSRQEFQIRSAEIQQRYVQSRLAELKKDRNTPALNVQPEPKKVGTALFDESIKGSTWGGRKYGDNLRPRVRSIRKR